MQICQQAASMHHIRLVRGNVQTASERHKHLTDTPRSHHTPPRGYATWRNFPSCVTWASHAHGQMPDTRGRNPLSARSGLVEDLHRAGAVVVASSPHWGWALLSSPQAEIGAKELVLSRQGAEWAGSVWEASKEELMLSGLPIARERPATSSLTANRLINSALRPGAARGKRLRDTPSAGGDEASPRGVRGSR
jgi:hypothetical protein